MVRHVADALGLPVRGSITGAEIAELSDAALGARVEDVDLYARLSPDQKTRVVRALRQEPGERHALDCEFLASGTDYVFRDERALERFAAELDALAELGIASERIDGETCLREEPSLLPGVVGAVRFPGDARLRPDRFVAEASKIDRTAKGRGEGDAWVALERLLLAIADAKAVRLLVA